MAKKYVAYAKKNIGKGQQNCTAVEKKTQRDRKLGFAAESKKTGCMVKNRS